MRIEHWVLLNSFSQVVSPNEPLFCRIRGLVYGNLLFEDGQQVVTSHVIATKNGKVVTRSDSQYELGVPDKGYQKTFPFDVKQAMMANLPRLSAS